MSQSGACAQATNQASFNRNSTPSELRITDMRFVLVASNYDYPIIRIDTNQGVYGLGEARDAGREGAALVLKPHLVGKNPLYIEPILDTVRNFANPSGWGADTAPSILDSQQQIKRLYDTFGPKRLMAGSDWPLVEKCCTYKQAIDIARNQIAFFSPEDKRWICGQTAQQVWRFEL
jgi:hypothetical protein